ncbi:FAD/NAD(P)-binding domain-containing protein [Ramaria rubella]|nr:FAD/NAD(P)-binding domain-containing protein [Ramaria rubella]
MTDSTRLRVAICGGGIGGLTLALALAPYRDLTINIYEAATRFEEIGAGLAIWGRGVAALKKLGLEERLRAIAPGNNQETKFQLRKADLPFGGEAMGELVLSYNMGFHRAQFVDLLVSSLNETGRATTHFGKRCVSFTQCVKDSDNEITDDNIVTIHFADGTSAPCDMLIGCDGIKSAVRGQLMTCHGLGRHQESTSSEGLQKIPGTTFTGTVAYRALVKPDELRKISADHDAITVRKMYCGKDKHIVTYPVAGGRFINLIAYSSDPARQKDWENGPWVVEVEHEEVFQQYKDFEPQAQALLKCINKPSRWAMYGVDILPPSGWSQGRVAVLGDAAHAMAPFIGSGGGQVIEDVYVLSRLLGSLKTTRRTLPLVLRAYEQVRRPRVNRVIMCTREALCALEFQGAYEGAPGETVEQGLRRMTSWLWEGNGDPDDDVQQAEKLFEDMLAGHDTLPF